MSEDVRITRDGRREVTWGRITTFTNTFFFLFAGLAAVWLVILAFLDTRSIRWLLILFVVVLWAAMAYIFLPRLYKLMTAIFLPDYFIGRTRTGAGILGDVVNMAWDGSDENIHRAMQAAGWTLAKPITLKSALRIVMSVLTHTSDPDAPVSPLYLFGRQQDFAYQKQVDGSASQRHHIRFWKCPDEWPLPGGTEVEWLAAAAFDKGVRLSAYTLQVTHEISGDIDAERDYTITTVKAVVPDLHVRWIDKFSTAFHARNGGGDMVHTDGNLPIINLEELSTSVPQLSSEEAHQVRRVDPPPARTLAEKLRQTRRPWTLFVVLALTAVGIATMVHAVSGDLLHSTPLVWIVAAAYVVAVALLFYGFAAARWLLMVLAGGTALDIFVSWWRHDFHLPAGTSFLHVAITVVLLIILSSDSITTFTREVTAWRRAR